MKHKFFASAISAFFLSLAAVAVVTGEQTFAQSPVFNHGIAGDWDTDSDCVAVANLMASKGVKTVIGLGDYGYEDSAATWWRTCLHNNNDLTQPKLGPGWSMWGAIGNHERTQKPAYIGVFGQDSPVTSTIRDKHYQIFMDTSDHIASSDRCDPTIYKVGTSQYNKVKLLLNDAKAKKASGEINWISVSLHCNVYSSSSQHPPTTDLRPIYQQLWENADVDFVFSGHNHNYERTYPLTWTGTNYQICNPGQTTGYVDLDDNDCIIFFTVGTGGRTGETLKSAPPYIVPTERTLPYGYLNMGIDNTKGEVRFQMFKTDGKTISDITVKRTIVAPQDNPALFDPLGQADITFPHVDMESGNHPTDANAIPTQSDPSTGDDSASEAGAYIITPKSAL